MARKPTLKTGIPLPPTNMLDGMHNQRRKLDGHLTKRHRKILPPTGF